jgi:transcriptional regulator with GAF, ATPase, and Fis domain
MKSKVETSSPENRFPGRLTRRMLVILLPITFLPIIVAIIDIFYLSTFPTLERIIGILLVSLFFGTTILLILNRYINSKFIKPILILIETIRHFSLGDFKQRSRIDQSDEIGRLARLTDNVGDIFHNRLLSLELELNNKDLQLRITSELSKILSSVVDLDNSLQQITDLIVDRFNYKRVAIYIFDQENDKVRLRVISGQSNKIIDQKEETIPVEITSLFNWVLKFNQPKVFSQRELENIKLPSSVISKIKSAVAIPISIKERLNGIIFVQDRKEDKFRDADIEILSTISYQIAPFVNRILSSEPNSPVFPKETFLYNASYTIITADDRKQVFAAVKNVLNQMPYAAALLIAEQNSFSTSYITNRLGQELPNHSIDEIPLTLDSITHFISKPYPISVAKLEDFKGLPESLILICRNLQFDSFKIYPLVANDQIEGLLIFGPSAVGKFSSSTLDLIKSLVEVTKTSLERINALQTITSHLAELHTINTISQSISSETNLEKLYDVVHQQIINVMGSVNFLIALYSESTDTIEIPYMDDGDEIQMVPPYPLGEGLTSIIIKTRQPLMIVEDTINRSRALGAIVTGDKPALSWLGVPMLLRDQIIGAIVVQDLEKEHRFNENDMRLLTTLAAQIANAIRTTRLIETAQKRSLRDRQLYEITSKIRREFDIQGILSTTAQELSEALGVHSAHIRIEPEPLLEVINDNGSNGKEGKSA